MTDMLLFVYVLAGLFFILSLFCLKKKIKEQKSCFFVELFSSASAGLTLVLSATVMYNTIQIRNSINLSVSHQEDNSQKTTQNVLINEISNLSSKVEQINNTVSVATNRIKRAEDSISVVAKKVDRGSNINFDPRAILKGSVSFECNPTGDGSANCKWIPGKITP